MILIFDLDGTLLSINSFPYWVRYLLKGEFGELSTYKRTLLSIRTAKIMLERKIGGKSHYVAKRQLQALWVDALKQDPHQHALHNFCKILNGYLRPNLAEVLLLAAQNKLSGILATAAAGEYALNFGHMLGFTHILTTPLYSVTPGKENVREEKRDRVLAFLSAEGLGNRKRIFFTDHAEDLPLISESHIVLWFGDESTLEEVRQTAPAVRIIFARELSGAEIMELFTDSL